MGFDFQYFGFVLRVRIAELKREAEPVELRFRQREGSGECSRILGGYEEKRLRQFSGNAVYGDLFFLHRLEKGRLGAGRGSVELVREHCLGFYGARTEYEVLGFRVPYVHAEHVCGQ